VLLLSLVARRSVACLLWLVAVAVSLALLQTGRESSRRQLR